MEIKYMNAICVGVNLGTRKLGALLHVTLPHSGCCPEM